MSIAYRQGGSGPPIVLIGGAFCTAASFDGLASLLAHDFAVTVYDRRGRGESGDTKPYAVQREVEDLATILEVCGPAAVYGHSSGAILAVEGTIADLAITRLVVYEPPYVGHPAPGLGPRLEELLVKDQMEAASTEWLLATGVPSFIVESIVQSPAWPGMVRLAPTLLYDLALTGDAQVPSARLATVNLPTLVAHGALSPDPLRNGSEGLTAAIHGATSLTCDGQHHGVDDAAIASVIADFCDEGSVR